ncbi:MAG: TlpA family protein disulfide reductase [Gammaproteobacteria bacterium]|nr:TlpA family protein disulfide reductase [Gammaproteobacteria bacterium]MBU1443128.1 TlpA family protein disulfide reductase [Gammaproteobacteria bacterium]
MATRRKWLFGGVGLAAAAAGAGVGLWKHGGPLGQADPVMGAEFWDQSFERPEGGDLKLASLKGRPLLINFWATWCPPCVEEMPAIDAFFREQAPNGMQVVGLAIDQPSAVRKFLTGTPVSYPIGMAGMQGTEMVKQLGNTAGGLPYSLMLDPKGVVRARKMGKLEAADFEAWQRT